MFPDEDDKVVRVAHHVEARPTTFVVGFQALLRPVSGFVAWIGNPALVSLVDGREIDVGQKRRDDTPLRGAGPRMPTVALDHDVGLQEGEHEPQDLAVPDAAAHPVHQHVMIDSVETPLDIPFDHIPRPRGTAGCRVQPMPHPCERVMGASGGPEAVRGRIEVRLEDRFQHQLERHLDQSVFERGNAQWAELPRLARLWDKPLSNRLGLVGSSAQVLSDVLQKTCDAIGPPFDLLPRHAIRARRVAAPIPGQPLPSAEQCSAVAYDIEQIREPLVGVRGTPPIQLALHVENRPGIHRVGQMSLSCLQVASTARLRHVDGFPALGLLRRLRPRFARSPVASAIRSPRGGNAGGFPSSTVTPCPL